jgi:hypothetical protein
LTLNEYSDKDMTVECKVCTVGLLSIGKRCTASVVDMDLPVPSAPSLIRTTKNDYVDVVVSWELLASGTAAAKEAAAEAEVMARAAGLARNFEVHSSETSGFFPTQTKRYLVAVSTDGTSGDVTMRVRDVRKHVTYLRVRMTGSGTGTTSVSQ